MDPLRIVPLGGLGEFGCNMMTVEWGDSVIAVDCGVMFPGPELLGIDLVIPDISYLTDQGKAPEAIVLTHAHEDHIGALPYLLRRFRAPVYGTRLTLEFLRHKLREHRLEESTELVEIVPGERFAVGPFTLEGIPVTHSLVNCVALAIETPVGVVVHTGDFKIDNTPMDGEEFDFHRFAAYGDKGVLLLLSDSTNVERAGCTPSERSVGQGLRGIFGSSPGRIFIATFASHIPRIQQVADLASEFGRKLVLSGRSIIHNTGIAADLGYLRLPHDAMTDNQGWQDAPDDQLCFLTTGSQGEPLSVLHRVAFDEHRSIRIRPGDAVALSARFIPGNEKSISSLIDHLYRRGARVHYERASEIHVSGHASQEELKTMIRLTRPRYFVPVHGEFRQLCKHVELARAVGVPADNCFLLENGDALELTERDARRAEPVPAGKVFVDGKGIGDVEDIVVRDRRHLSEDGLVVVAMAVHQRTGEVAAGPDLMARGVVRPEEEDDVLGTARDSLQAYVEGCGVETRMDSAELKEGIRRSLRKFFEKRLHRRPAIVPYIMEM